MVRSIACRPVAWRLLGLSADGTREAQIDCVRAGSRRDAQGKSERASSSPGQEEDLYDPLLLPYPTNNRRSSNFLLVVPTPSACTDLDYLSLQSNPSATLSGHCARLDVVEPHEAIP